MKLDTTIYERARLARDPRFDGLFFTGVKSTGIFCRPIYPAPPPKAENVIYYPTAAAAIKAGLRPCLRCRPEAAPDTPAWNGTSATVARALNLIRQGASNDDSLETLASRLGIGSRHLRRLFQNHLGASPLKLAIAHWLMFAQKLIVETGLSMTRIAEAAGFGSIRRFNAAYRNFYNKMPSEERRKGSQTSLVDGTVYCRLNLPYRPPFDWPAILALLDERTIAGVEYTENDAYWRTFRPSDATDSFNKTKSSLLLEVQLSQSRPLMAVVERVRCMFDLDTNMAAIHAVLSQDSLLAPLIKKRSGLRVPVAWDPFETAVRAIVGQQVSVKAACTILGRIVAQTGYGCQKAGHPSLRTFFSTAEALSKNDLPNFGLPQKRQNTLQTLARKVASGEIAFCGIASLTGFIGSLTAIPGIGEWTAHYIAMRVLGEPDAFPANGLGIKRAFQTSPNSPLPTQKQILARARSWQPWRAYAAIHLWNG